MERLDPGITGVRALAFVALTAVIATGVFFWTTRPASDSYVQSATEAPATAPPDLVPAQQPTAELIVHVAGNVRRPGIVTLSPGSRVHEAVSAAGGLRPKAQVGPLNLARKVTDGEQITIGKPPTTSTTPAAASDPATPTPVNLNTATAEELQRLPGIGPVLAQRIIAHRTTQGPFQSPDQLRNVTGIGPRRYADLTPHITVLSHPPHLSQTRKPIRAQPIQPPHIPTRHPAAPTARFPHPARPRARTQTPPQPPQGEPCEPNPPPTPPAHTTPPPTRPRHPPAKGTQVPAPADASGASPGRRAVRRHIADYSRGVDKRSRTPLTGHQVRRWLSRRPRAWATRPQPEPEPAEDTRVSAACDAPGTSPGGRAVHCRVADCPRGIHRTSGRAATPLTDNQGRWWLSRRPASLGHTAAVGAGVCRGHAGCGAGRCLRCFARR
ncbi:helix-hairpin-helix domain-containing protein [Actinocorallia sp. API 0066]|nr:helix-hairpin-helix domain-containing protein [Actinocorallia sp. API 0066]